jgi:hypothetical protein
MNPMKWPVWVRIVVAVIVLLIVCAAPKLIVNMRLAAFIVILLLPVVLFWGVAWIILGISKRESRGRVIKVLIGVLVWIPVVFIIIVILYQWLFVKPNG